MKPQEKIGEKTLEALGALLTNALLAHRGPLNMAFIKNGQDDLKIGLKGIIKPGPAEGNFKLKVDIDYVIEKATDSFTSSVDEKQTFLPLDEPTRLCPEREDGLEIFESVCMKCKKRESVLVCDGVNMPIKFDRFDVFPHIDDALISRMPCRAWADDDYKEWCDGMVLEAGFFIAAQKEEQEKPKLKKVMGGKR